MKGAIVVGGREFPCAAPVRHWSETSFFFVCRMRSATRFIVNHWTGAENSAERCFRNMRDRINPATKRPEPYSVHFIVDQLGDIYQCCDADARCAHAVENGGNTFGVGIEIINRGNGTTPAKGFERSRRTERIHGRPVTYGDFFPAQVAAVVALNAALCGAYGLPLRAPLTPAGTVFPDVLPQVVLGSYTGCLGHLHLDAGKSDPGLDLLARIHAAGLGVG